MGPRLRARSVALASCAIAQMGRKASICRSCKSADVERGSLYGNAIAFERMPRHALNILYNNPVAKRGMACGFFPKGSTAASARRDNKLTPLVAPTSYTRPHQRPNCSKIQKSW